MIAPESYEAWEEYVYHGRWLSRTMRRILGRNVDVLRLSTDEELASLTESEKSAFFDTFFGQFEPRQ